LVGFVRKSNLTPSSIAASISSEAAGHVGAGTAVDNSYLFCANPQGCSGGINCDIAAADYYYFFSGIYLFIRLTRLRKSVRSNTPGIFSPSIPMLRPYGRR